MKVPDAAHLTEFLTATSLDSGCRKSMVTRAGGSLTSLSSIKVGDVWSTRKQTIGDLNHSLDQAPGSPPVILQGTSPASKSILLGSSKRFQSE